MAIGNPITLTNNVASKIISVTATDGQTTFTVTGGYRINQLAVSRNGVQLSQSSDFTANDGSTVTLLSAANVGDTVLFEVFDDFRVADAIQSNAPAQTIDGNLNVTGTLTGASIGIQSAGTSVGAAKTLNFIGTGNTFLDNGDGTIDVAISGSGGSGFATALSSDQTSVLNRFFKTTEEIPIGAGTSVSIESDDTSGNVAFVREGRIHVGVGATFHVGSGTTLITNVLGVF